MSRIHFLYIISEVQYFLIAWIANLVYQRLSGQYEWGSARYKKGFQTPRRWTSNLALECTVCDPVLIKVVIHQSCLLYIFDHINFIPPMRT